MERQRRAGAEIDIAALQRLAQDIAEHVVGETGEEAGRDAEAAERDRRVEDRAAGIGRKAPPRPPSVWRGSMSIRASPQQTIMAILRSGFISIDLSN